MEHCEIGIYSGPYVAPSLPMHQPKNWTKYSLHSTTVRCHACMLLPCFAICFYCFQCFILFCLLNSYSANLEFTLRHPVYICQIMNMFIIYSLHFYIRLKIPAFLGRCLWVVLHMIKNFLSTNDIKKEFTVLQKLHKNMLQFIKNVWLQM